MAVMLQSWLPCKEMRDVLLPAFAPCTGFSTSCTSMRWIPQAGHVPRDFCGATGELRDVRLVLVVAEPGDPHPGEAYEPTSPAELLASVCQHAYGAFAHGTDLFHRNIRGILNDCWPSLTFDEQLRRTWITESVLCSATKECGPVRSRVYRACASTYLGRQLALLPDAVVAALGAKARDRMKHLGRPYIRAGAVAPSGCHQPRVRQSWKAISAAVTARAAAAATA
jgi:hypothetical protein